MLTPKEAWQATLGQLQLQLNRATFDTWLKGSELQAYEDGDFIVRVRHAYAKDWLEKHLQQQITKTLSDIFERSVKINFVVQPPVPPADQSDDGPLFAAAESAPSATAAPDKEHAEPDPAAAHAETPAPPKPDEAAPVEKPAQALGSAAPQIQAAPRPDYSEWDPRVTDVRSTPPNRAESDAPFNRDHTFEAFVTGPSNHFAHAAAKAVAEAPGKQYNPLVMYGGVGLGKTHLLHAIGHVCHAVGKRVLYVTAEMFTNDTVTAIRSHTTDELRERYRTVDVLLVDDIQFMAGKSSTEEEFYHTFNAIVSRGGQIVVAGNQHPHEVDKMDDRLRSRFEGGLLADIQAPELETRLAILHAKSTAQGTSLPSDVAGILARHATENVRELEGLLTQILARASLARQPLTVTLAEQIVNRSNPQPHRRAVALSAVFEAAATYHQLSMDDLLSKRRTKEVVHARHVAMYLAREMTEASFPQIGAALGGRNHTTVLHGYQKIAGTVEADETLQRELNDLRRQLQMFPNN